MRTIMVWFVGFVAAMIGLLLYFIGANQAMAHHGTGGMNVRNVVHYPNGQVYMMKETFLNHDKKTKNQAVVMEYDIAGNARVVIHISYKNDKEVKRVITRYNHLGHRILK